MTKDNLTKLVCISGNIGVGKTTLVESLSNRYGWHVVPEPYEANPFLPSFYADMKRWAFHSQMFFLAKRLRLYLKSWGIQGIVIQDRTIFEDAEIFAYNLYLTGQLSLDEYQMYQDLYQSLLLAIRRPSLVIYLQASPAVLIRRIATRGREYEKGMSEEYIEKLNELYDAWASSFTLCPLLTIDTTNIDLDKNPEYLKLIEDKCAVAVQQTE